MFKSSKAFGSFSVDDIDVARTFYKETLGLDVRDRPEGLNINYGLGGSTFIYPKDDHAPATFTVLNFIVDDIEKTIAELGSKGIDMQQYDMGQIKTDERGIMRDPQTGFSIAWFKDPAGNVIAVFQES